MEIKERIKQYKEEMIQDLNQLVSYNSVQDQSNPMYPFGKENAKCLKAALEVAEKCGMSAVNLANYIGYGEIGEGDEVIGVLGHLDIVPVGEGWNTNPLEVTEIEGKLYGRGVSDDKGALIASAYAIRILKDMNYPMKKRIRLIMGCNEESGSACLDYYVKKEGHVDYGFTPDAVFPGVFGEKGMVGGTFHSIKTKILHIEGGSVSNVVCERCITEIPLNSCDTEVLKKHFQDNQIQAEIIVEQTIQLEVKGVAAHASTPDLGVNAIAHTMKALQDAGFEDDFVDFYMEKIGLSTTGEYCGVELNDDYGALTFNNGVISMQEGTIMGTIDIRFPVTMKAIEIVNALKKGFESTKGIVKVTRQIEPLFYPKESVLVTSLLKAYQDVTKDMHSEPVTMGGGTYAKGIKNCIAFGCEFANENNHIHDANEVLKVESFLLQVEIYVTALMNLLNL